MSAGRYEIRLKGHLGPRWAARFDGMTLTTRADGTTLIEGLVVDLPAALILYTPVLDDANYVGAGADTGVTLGRTSPELPAGTRARS
jgi:hypothetical protein